MSNCRPAKIPISPRFANSLIIYEDQAEKSIVTWYQSALGAFIWLVIHSCPDLAYSEKVFSWFCGNRRPVHVELVKYILRYLSETLELGLTFDGEVDISDNVIGYTNSNFVKSKSDWQSTKGYVFILAEAVISHSSKFQSIIALCIYKAEYVTICEVRKKLV